MIHLHGGPCEGVYAVKRAPMYLRAVRNRGATKAVPGSGMDVLDQLDDTPDADEDIYVYRIRSGTEGHVHLNMGSRGTGFYALGEYDFLPDVEGEPLRATEAWRAWAESQPAVAERSGYEGGHSVLCSDECQP